MPQKSLKGKGAALKHGVSAKMRPFFNMLAVSIALFIALFVTLPMAEAGWFFGRNSSPDSPSVTEEDVVSSLGAFGIQWGPNQKSCDSLLTLKSKEYRANTQYGDPTTVATMINYSLEAAGPRGSELLNIFKTVRRGKKIFLKNLNVWMEKSGLKLMSLSELGNFVKEKTRAGVLPQMTATEVIAFHGYINNLVYTQALKSGRMIMADPHDVFSHLPSLLDPDFVEILKAHGDLVYQTGKSFGETIVTPQVYLTFETDTQINYKLYHILTGAIRNYTVENWSYLSLNENFEPRLFLQGNRAFNAILSLVLNDAEVEPIEDMQKRMVELLLVSPHGPDSLYAFTNLPQWNGFIQTKQGFDLDRELRGLLQDVVLSDADYKAQSEFIRNRIVHFRIAHKTKAERSKHFPDLLNELALKIQGDPKLAQAFSRDSRIKLSRTLLQVIEAYRHWILDLK